MPDGTQYQEMECGGSDGIFRETDDRKILVVSGVGGVRNDIEVKYYSETGECLQSNASSISSIIFCAAAFLSEALRMGLPTTR